VERTVASLASACVACCALVLWLSWEVLSEPRPAEAQTTGTCPNAQLIDTFEGNGDQQTDTFRTTTDSFRVSFEATKTAGGNITALLFIDVIDAGNPNGIPVATITQQGGGQGETFANAPPGTYYLDIGAANLEYTITVEQCEGGNPSRNPNPGRGGPPVVRDQYGADKRVGPIDRPAGVIPRTSVRRVPRTGGPPYLAVGAVVLLGVALIAGRGVLKR
jgi:hypothetical protein